MSKSAIVAQSLPGPAATALRQLGEDLAIARKRRKESQRDWAARIGVSPPTLIRMERGDPGVSMGVYATALWLMGRSKALGELAAPLHDLLALESEVRAAKARSVRSPTSVSARLSRASRSDEATAPQSDETTSKAAESETTKRETTQPQRTSKRARARGAR